MIAPTLGFMGSYFVVSIIMSILSDREPILGEVVDRDTYFDKEVEYGGEQEVALHETIWNKVTQEFEHAGESVESTGPDDESHMILEDGDSLTYISVGPEKRLFNSSAAVTRDIRVYVNNPNCRGAILLSIPFDEQGNVTQFPQMGKQKRITYSSQPCYIAGPDLRIQLRRDQNTARILPAKDWAGSDVNYTQGMRALTESATPESIVQEILDHAKGTTGHAESEFMRQSETVLMRTALHEIIPRTMIVVIDPESRKVAVLTIPTREQKGLSSDQCVATHMDYDRALRKTTQHWERIWCPQTFKAFEELCERIRGLEKNASDI